MAIYLVGRKRVRVGLRDTIGMVSDRLFHKIKLRVHLIETMIFITSFLNNNGFNIHV